MSSVFCPCKFQIPNLNGNSVFKKSCAKNRYLNMLRYKHFINFRQEDLFHILKAYTIHNPHDGYCQGQAPLAAVLLMHMPAEEAFWSFVSICDKYLPGYYSPGLVCLRSSSNLTI